LDLPADGVLVASMVRGQTEALVGGHVDPVFGPVVVVGAGGKYVEVSPDVQVLLPPFDAEQVLHAISRLRLAPLLAGVRGEPATDTQAWADAAVQLGGLLLHDGSIRSVDINPLMVGAGAGAEDSPGIGAVAVDAVVVVG
jgi:hypothetical protein